MAEIPLFRDDWMLVPQLLRSARGTMRVVKTNLAFTAVYNLVGLSLAALGLLPPILAAGAQSLPDLGILANSSRLLRQRRRASRDPPQGGQDTTRIGTEIDVQSLVAKS